MGFGVSWKRRLTTGLWILCAYGEPVAESCFMLLLWGIKTLRLCKAMETVGDHDDVVKVGITDIKKFEYHGGKGQSFHVGNSVDGIFDAGGCCHVLPLKSFSAQKALGHQGSCMSTCDIGDQGEGLVRCF